MIVRLTRVLAKLSAYYGQGRRPPISTGIKYTKDVVKGKYFDIGEYTYGVPKVVPDVIWISRLKVGRFCSIAEGVTILLGGAHPMSRITTYPFKAFPDDWPPAALLPPTDPSMLRTGDVTIGNDVWIGHGALILAGADIGDGAVVGAAAVVAGRVEPYSIVVGNPARVIRKRFDEDTIQKLLEVRWWDWPTERINANLDVIFGFDLSRIDRLL